MIICFPQKEDESGTIILHLDSLGLHSSRSIFDNIKRYVCQPLYDNNQNSFIHFWKFFFINYVGEIYFTAYCFLELVLKVVGGESHID